MSCYKSIFLALREQDMEELLSEITGFDKIFYKVKTRETVDETYKLLIVEDVNAYSNKEFFDVIETFIENRRHAYVWIGENNDYDTDILTSDEEGEDGEFEDILPVNVRVDVDEYFYDDNPFRTKRIIPRRRGMCYGL